MCPPEGTFLVALFISNSVMLPLYETGELFPPDVGSTKTELNIIAPAIENSPHGEKNILCLKY